MRGAGGATHLCEQACLEEGAPALDRVLQVAQHPQSQRSRQVLLALCGVQEDVPDHARRTGVHACFDTRTMYALTSSIRSVALFAAASIRDTRVATPPTT